MEHPCNQRPDAEMFWSSSSHDLRVFPPLRFAALGHLHERMLCEAGAAGSMRCSHRTRNEFDLKVASFHCFERVLAFRSSERCDTGALLNLHHLTTFRSLNSRWQSALWFDTWGCYCSLSGSFQLKVVFCKANSYFVSIKQLSMLEMNRHYTSQTKCP